MRCLTLTSSIAICVSRLLILSEGTFFIFFLYSKLTVGHESQRLYIGTVQVPHVVRLIHASIRSSSEI
jgi:hypothetical protein